MVSYQARLFTTLAVLACALLVMGYMVAQPIRSESSATTQVTLDDAITYQGRLTAPDGTALNGTHDMRFLLYSSDVGGSTIWDSGAQSVTVENGLFNSVLDVNQSDFTGQALWLELNIEGQTLSPRQPIRAAPYALSLRPGALIERDSAGSTLTTRNMATGPALRAEAEDQGLFASGGNFAVYGEGDGYGGYFTSTLGVGVFGGSSASPSTQNPSVPGIHGRSQFGTGILGEGSLTGVRGQAATGAGVHGDAHGIGIFGQSKDFAVYGVNTAPAQGAGYGGYFQSSTGVGVFGNSTAQPATQNRYAPGVWGRSEHGAAILGTAGGIGSVAGLFEGDVRIDGNLLVIDDITAGGSKDGYVTDIARNDGDTPLSTGDLVIVTGVAPAVLGDIPVPTVRLADSAFDRAVIGVVARDFDPDNFNAEPGNEIAPDDYLKIVTLGAFAAVKVDAQYGAIRPGDLLVSSETPGHAKAVAAHEDAPTGTVIGKALDGWETGTGLIPIQVTLQ